MPELAVVDTFMIGRVEDSDDYDALLGPSIGYIRGEGDVFSGTLLSSDGTPVAPGGVTVLASTDGRLTVSVVVVVGSPDDRLGSDTHQHVVRGAADQFLKTEKIPRGLAGIWRHRGIGRFLERRLQKDRP